MDAINDKIIIKDKVTTLLQSGVEQTKDDLIGFLYGTKINGPVCVCGCYANKNFKEFEEDFIKITDLLPAGLEILGIFFKTNQADVTTAVRNTCKNVLPSSSVLYDCFDSEEFLALSIDEKTKRFNLFWFNFEHHKLRQVDFTPSAEDEIAKSCVLFRIKATLTVGFEHSDVKSTLISNIEAEMDNLKDVISSSLSVYHVDDSNLLLYNRSEEEWPETSQISFDSDVTDLTNRLESDKDSKKKMRLKESNQTFVSVQLFQQFTGNIGTNKIISCTPVIHHEHKKYKFINVQLPLDTLALAPHDMSIDGLLGLFNDAIVRQLDAMSRCLVNSSQELVYRTPKPFHFHPTELDTFLTVIYPEGISDANLELNRKSLHEGFLLPMTSPLFRRSRAVTFSDSASSSVDYLLNVHVGLKASGVVNGKQSIVRGSYEYHHYMQDKIDDNGWGCAYRSLQTLASWLRLQSYTDKLVPTHAQIQKALVDIEDKPASFVGSKQWIGSMEVGYVLDQIFGVTCKVLHVSSGAEMASKAREIAHHFETQGTPIMIGGGVLAHTILGVDWNEGTGDVKFLILDPHYTGPEDLKFIQDKGWCGWKGPEFWNQQAYYNMCMPQKPVMY